jgi:hypothetical protein
MRARRWAVSSRIIGWDLILDAPQRRTVAVGWSAICSLARSRHRHPVRAGRPPPEGLFNLPAAIIVCGGRTAVIGIKRSADTNTLLKSDESPGARCSSSRRAP